MAEESQAGQTRRARRRAAQQEGPEAEEAKPTTEGARADVEVDAAEEQAGGSAAAVVREENRKARRAAAAKRRAKRDAARARAVEVGLDAGEVVDDALARGTDTTVKWVRKHFNALQWVIVLGLAAWIGWEVYSMRQAKAAAQASDALMTAIAAERARIGSPSDQGKPDDTGSIDRRRIFASEEAKETAVVEDFKAAEEVRPGSAAAGMAKLGLAGAYYDQGKYGEALKLYESVQNSKLANLDPDAKGRAIEGAGLCLEAEGKFEEARKRYQELTNAEIPGYRELGMYHQARMYLKQDEPDQAKELLKKVVDKFAKSDDPPTYLFEAAKQLLGSIDPSAVPQPSADEALKKALEQFQKELPEGVNVPAIPTPAAP